MLEKLFHDALLSMARCYGKEHGNSAESTTLILLLDVGPTILVGIGGEGVLPGLGASGMGIFSLQGIGQIDISKAGLEVTVVELCDGLQMLLESALHVERQHGDPVLRALAISDRNLVIREVDVLDP